MVGSVNQNFFALFFHIFEHWKREGRDDRETSTTSLSPYSSGKQTQIMNAQQGGYKSYFWHFYNLIWRGNSTCTAACSLLLQFFSPVTPEKKWFLH